MAFSEGSAALHFYAQQLDRLRKIPLPRDLLWTVPTAWGKLELRTTNFRGRQYYEPFHDYNYYGDADCNNVVFFFKVGDEFSNHRWSITIHDYDDPKLPVQWSLNTPSEYRGGFPSDLERKMRELIEGMFRYAKDMCGYKPEVSDEEMAAFFDGIRDKVQQARVERDTRYQAEMKENERRVHEGDCGCDYCKRILHVFSNRVE